MGYRKLGRTSSQRKAMLRDLTTDLIINERIQTTESAGYSRIAYRENMITLGKRGDLHARRQAASYIRRELVTATDEEGTESTVYALQKLFDDVAPRYADRQGGYTRIMKMGPRRGDGAPVVVIELV